MIDALRCREPGWRAPFLFVLAVAMLSGCTPAEQGPEDPASAETQLEAMDGLMAELGGRPTADLTRGQRWRLVSSIGVGLPPSSFRAEDLPEPESHGAALVETYCDRCHWIPAPQQHAASEWPILMRRMQTRAETLGERLGGPITEGLMGEYVLAGMATAPLPSEDELAVMTEYMQKHAMPEAQPGELGESEDAAFYGAKCSACHVTPSPSAHTAAEWPEVVGRMQANAALQDVRPLNEEEMQRIITYLQGRVGG
jgi:cytochrome c5